MPVHRAHKIGQRLVALPRLCILPLVQATRLERPPECLILA